MQPYGCAFVYIYKAMNNEVLKKERKEELMVTMTTSGRLPMMVIDTKHQTTNRPFEEFLSELFGAVWSFGRHTLLFLPRDRHSNDKAISDGRTWRNSQELWMKNSILHIPYMSCTSVTLFYED